jgi:hypothetical protein
MMVDFNKGKEILHGKFRGSEVKTAVMYENDVYMLKYPDPIREKRNVLSYMNNQFSEHIGSSIFRACGFEAQETALGYFNAPNGKEKVVVGCKDLTQNGGTLIEFSIFENQTMIEGKRGTSIESVHEVITHSNLIQNKREILDKFWDMFVIDTLIGNPDRHFDNWGLLEKGGIMTFAPIYDCGSALAALVSNEKMEALLLDPTEMKKQEYNITSVYYFCGKRIFCHEIFNNPPKDLIEAIKRTVPGIDMEKICGIVDSTPIMPEVRKAYLKQAMCLRYDQILAPALKRTRTVAPKKESLLARLDEA